MYYVVLSIRLCINANFLTSISLQISTSVTAKSKMKINFIVTFNETS